MKSTITLNTLESVCYIECMGKDFRWWMIPLALVIVLLVLFVLLSLDSGSVLPHEYNVH